MQIYGGLVAPYPFTINSEFPSASPAANLANERLGRAWSTSQSNGYVVIDLGSSRPVDCIALLATNAPTDGTWYVWGSDSADGANGGNNLLYQSAVLPAWPSPEAGRRVHRQMLLTLPATVTARYWRISVSSPTTTFRWTAGRLVIGRSLVVADTCDLGWSFKIFDYGDAKTSSLGLANNTILGKSMEFAWTWSWMSETEARGTLLDIQAYAGLTRDLLLVLTPYSPDVHNVIGYGTLQEAVENTQTSDGMPGLGNTYSAGFRLRSRLLLSL